MLKLFTAHSAYKRSARVLAIVWTLLIFILCLIPGSSLPEVDIPLVDKWAHVILFGVFSFLWLCGYPSRNIRFLIVIFLITLFLGWLVEYIQGHWVANRSQDNMDTLADAIGGVVGILIFAALSYAGDKKTAKAGIR
jgi:VanZ family protein